MGTKKIFFLSLIMPLFMFIWAFLNYEKNPIACGNFKTPVKCKSFLEYLNSFWGEIYIILAVISFITTLLILLTISFFSKKKRKIGYIFLLLSILFSGLLFLMIYLYIFGKFP